MKRLLCLSIFLIFFSIKPSSAEDYPYQRYVQDASERYGVEEPLIRAVIHAESNYNQFALSHKGALGLMQLLITTAREYEPWVSRFQLQEEPDVNIDIGARHLKDLERQVKRRYPHVKGTDRIKLIAAAYNAGWGRVVRSGGRVPRILETRTYVRRVSRYYQRYGGKMKSKPVNQKIVNKKQNKDVPASSPKPAKKQNSQVTRQSIVQTKTDKISSPTPMPQLTEASAFDFTRATVQFFFIGGFMFFGYVVMGWSHLVWLMKR